MKLIELIQIKNIFKPEMQFKNIQIGYKVIKFLKQIESDCTFYNEKIIEIVQECAEKNGDKIATTKDGNPIISKDKIDVWNKKIKELNNIKIDIALPSFNISDFDGCNLTLQDLKNLEVLISE